MQQFILEKSWSPLKYHFYHTNFLKFEEKVHTLTKPCARTLLVSSLARPTSVAKADPKPGTRNPFISSPNNILVLPSCCALLSPRHNFTDINLLFPHYFNIRFSPSRYSPSTKLLVVAFIDPPSSTNLPPSFRSFFKILALVKFNLTNPQSYMWIVASNNNDSRKEKQQNKGNEERKKNQLWM